MSLEFPRVLATVFSIATIACSVWCSSTSRCWRPSSPSQLSRVQSGARVSSRCWRPSSPSQLSRDQSGEAHRERGERCSEHTQGRETPPNLRR
eukprot:6192548-Prymnesium_polylepis.1